MLTKNANPKQPSTGEPPPYPANEFLARVSAHELSVKRLVEKVAADFRVLAKVPKPEAVVDPLARENLLDEYYLERFLDELLEEWVRLRPDEERVPVPSDITSLLDNAKHNAMILQQQIEQLHSTLEERTESDVGARLAFGSEAIRMIVIDAIDRVRNSLGLPRDSILNRGKRRGRRPLPESLKFLVAEMEYLALTLGSKGFGLPTTRPQKGRIIQMLDRLRKHLTNDPGLAWLADFLPAPGAHPVSVYQAAIKKSRTESQNLESAEE
jgi:hypothetical protein